MRPVLQRFSQLCGSIVTCFMKIGLHSGALLIAAVITMEAIFPLQSSLIPSLASHPVLVFLPFGVRILSAFFEGWWSILFLAPGAVIVNVMYFGGAQNDLAGWMNVLVVYAIPPMIFALLDWQNLGHRLDSHPLKAWRTMLIGGCLAAVTISLFLHVAEYHTLIPSEALTSMKMFAIGDFLGLVTLMLVAALVNRVIHPART